MSAQTDSNTAALKHMEEGYAYLDERFYKKGSSSQASTLALCYN